MTGFVFVNKPQGITSFAAAAKTRRIFGAKKAGHTGTLDPMATGVLSVALGGATKFIELLESHEKSYRATFRLGMVTDTLDITGKTVSTFEVTAKKCDVESVLPLFLGKIRQIPPMYSAVKSAGVRLYDLARQGIEVERMEREITIHSLELIGFDEEKHEYTIDVSCSSGTYIRTLISDIGEKLGCGAVMTALERTKANGIEISRCKSFDQLEQLHNSGKLESALFAVDEIIRYPRVTVTAAQAVRFSNGGALDLNRVRNTSENGYHNIYSPQGDFLGIGDCDRENGIMKVRRVLVR